MRLLTLTVTLAGLISWIPAWAQERAWEGDWDMHPFWWLVAALAVALLLLVLFGWALLNLAPVILGLVAAALGIRWLMRATKGEASRFDPAVSVLRERYARGEITKEEFEAKLRDLGGGR